MVTSRSEQLLRTTDLALATYLIIEGFTPVDLVKVQGKDSSSHPKGAWNFVETDTLRELVEDFHHGEARVEPDAFQKQLNATRREMFEYLGIGS